MTLTAAGPSGTDTLTRTNYIVVLAPPPVADFAAAPTNGIAPLTVTFTNLSSGATGYAWDFGDGNLSADADPANVYTNPGTYSVSLIANGLGGTNTLTRTNYIVVLPAPPAPGLLLVAPLLLTDGSFQFAISNADGTPVTPDQQSRMEVYAASDVASTFSNWMRLTNATWLTNSLLEVSDPDVGLSSRRFYRAVQRP